MLEAQQNKHIVVIGSINMDLVFDMDAMPEQGQTIFGKSFTTTPGGKGANQAIAAARLGGQVSMIGAVGKDAFAKELIHNLQLNQVDTTHIVTVNASTGVALIQLFEQDNRITVVSGANYALTAPDIFPALAMLQQAKLVVMQLELPVALTEYILQQCALAKIPVLFNPAPASTFKRQWLQYITYLTPNETECAQIFQQTPEQVAMQYEGQVIVTCGKEGVLFAEQGKLYQVPAQRVTAIDTTGAGDTFNGAFAVALTEGQSIMQALEFATAASALSVEKFGAQGGMPTRAELQQRYPKL